MGIEKRPDVLLAALRLVFSKPGLPEMKEECCGIGQITQDNRSTTITP
jgi:hypothetical protein